MKQIKSIALNSLYKLGYFEFLRSFQKKRVTILMYHRFSIEAEPFKVMIKTFENQIKYLIRKYNFISLEEYALSLCGETILDSSNTMILTIDDGYLDNYQFAYPIIKKYNIPATIFITTDFVNNKSWLWQNKLEYILKHSSLGEFEFPLGVKSPIFRVDSFDTWHKTQLEIFSYCRTIGPSKTNEFLCELAKHLRVSVPEVTTQEFQPLNWDHVKEMYENGVKFGAHTCSHPILTRLSLQEVEHELSSSKSEIEKHLDSTVESFCYPDGKENYEVQKLVQQHGFKCAVTTEIGFNNLHTVNRYKLKRIPISGDNKDYLMRQVTRKS